MNAPAIGGDRTHAFRITSPMLYQQSYGGGNSIAHFIWYFCTFTPGSVSQSHS